MNLDTNLIREERQTYRRLWLGAVSSLLVIAVIDVAMAIHVTKATAGQRTLELRLSRVSAQVKEIEKDYQARIERLPKGIDEAIQTLSALPAYNGAEPIHLLYQLEKRLPREVSLTQLHQERKEGTVVLQAKVSDSDAVAKLLENLEAGAEFGDVRMLSQENQRNGDVTVTVSFNHYSK